ncbi:DUF1742-domain-containing protein [Fomitiporia mediterranea MF3/22]|uniref:DUF1742-domain-containing protein n=1 Tax=Fomitiporia mediterranea (strain MF3/22) TaxID=694068 RepID=UPI0004409458|nr:DUF1742-domain-containing protein [Fomitiporia mediterranea MF3/22]EJD00894.1 DUF1742-domain-containing protein [Fomitiporia mediterranea MF3/22]
MSFANLYYKRAAATEKACFICSRPTTTVLATKDSVDFFYACDGHLKDHGFASLAGESGDGVTGARKLGLSDEEIQKVKEEYERKQQKKEKEKEKKDKADDKDKAEEGKEKAKETEKTKSKDISPSPGLAPSQSSGTSTPAGTHQRYTLHREIFAMRLGIHRKRRQTAQAKEVAPRLPSAPRLPVNNPPS